MATRGKGFSERKEGRDSAGDEEDASSYSTGASRSSQSSGSSYEDDYDDSKASSAFYSSQQSSSRSSRSYEDDDEDATSRSASSQSHSSYDDEDESRTSQSYTENDEEKEQEEESDSYYDDKDEYNSYDQSLVDIDDESRSSRSFVSERTDSFPESSTEDDDYTSGTDSTYDESSGKISSSLLEDEVRSFLSPQREQSSSFSLNDQQSKGSVLSAAISDQEAAWPTAACTSSASKSFEDDADDFFGNSHASSTSFPPPEDEDPFATESTKKAEATFPGHDFDAQTFPVQGDSFGIVSQSNTFLDEAGFDTNDTKDNIAFGNQSTTILDASSASSKRSAFSRKAPANQPSGDFFGSFYSHKSENKSESQRSSTIKSITSRSKDSDPGSKEPADPDGTNAGASSVASSIKSAQSKRHRNFADPFGIEPKRSISNDFGSFSDTQSKASSKLASMASDAEKPVVDLFSTEDPFAPTEFETIDGGGISVFSSTSNAVEITSDSGGFASFSNDADDDFFGASKSLESIGSRSQSHLAASKHSQKSQSTASSFKSPSKGGRSRASSHSGGKASTSGSKIKGSSLQKGNMLKGSSKSSVVSRTSSRGSQSSQSSSKKGPRMSISEFFPPKPFTTKGSSVVSALTSKDTMFQTPARDEASISLSEVFPPSPREGMSAAIQKSDQRASDSRSQSESKSSRSSKRSQPSKSPKDSKSSSRLSKASNTPKQESEFSVASEENGGSEASGARSNFNSNDGQADSLSFDSASVDSSKNEIGLSSFAGSESGLGTIMETQVTAVQSQPVINEFGASFKFNNQDSRSASNSASTASKGATTGSRSTSSDPLSQESRLGSNDGSLSGLSFSRSSWSKTTTKASEASRGSMSVSSRSPSSSKRSRSSTSENKDDESASSGDISHSKRSSTSSSFSGTSQSSPSNAFSQSKTSKSSSYGFAPSSRSSRTHTSHEDSGPASSTSSSQSSKASAQGFQTSQASSESRPSFMSESFSFGGSPRNSEDTSKGRTSASSAETSSRSSNSRPSSFDASSRRSELSPRSLRSRASSFGQDARSLSRRSSHFSATDQSPQSKKSGGSNGRSGRSGRSRTSSSNRRRGAPQSAGDSSRENQSRSSISSLLSFGERERSQSGRLSPSNIFESENGSRKSERSSSRRSESITRTHLKGSSSSSQRSRSRRRGASEKVKSQLPDIFFYGKSISLLKDLDHGLDVKNKEVHATVNSNRFRNVVSISYKKLSLLRPRLQYIISEAEWVHVHILLLYSRLFDCELHYHNITLPREFWIEIPEDLHVLEPIACVLASVGIVKDDQNGVTYIPVAKPYQGKSTYTPHNPEDVTEFLEWTVKDGIGYDWNSSWEAVEKGRLARKQLALEQGIKLPVNSTKRDEERQEQKLLDWNLLAIEKWLGYDDEIWFSYQQACHVLSRVADFVINPRELKTGSYAWLLPREEDDTGNYIVRVPRPSLTADTRMIALMFNFCVLPPERTSTWYLKSRPLKEIDAVSDQFLEAAFKQRKSSTANDAFTLEQ